MSLDVLRGLTVALMILVNTAGDGSVSYTQLRHSVWNGCTLTDLVFPMFLFIVGASVALALRSRLSCGVPHIVILRQVLQRSLLILLFGLLLNALPFFHLSDLRYFGVLQRIALCYALAAAVYLFGGIRAAAIVAVLTLLVYWYLLTRVSVPGFGVPGIDVPMLDPHGNLAAWLDRRLVAPAHLYHHSFYDPEGLLGTLPALGTTLFGVLAGCWLQTLQSANRKALGLAAAGIAFATTGLLWSHALPWNKRLWTSSYALWTAGISVLVLSLLFWLIDGPLKCRRGLTPWLAFGTNALTAYIFSEVVALILSIIPVRGAGNLQRWLYQLLPQRLGPPPLLSMLYSILFVAVCYLPVYILYRRRIFLKI
jgi:predicted acyltransferase